VHLIFQSLRPKFFKFSNLKIKHNKLETFKLETPYLQIGHGKPATLKQNTLDLEIRDGRPKILQIKHPILENWTL